MDFAYALDPDSQQWLGYFPGRPDLTEKKTVNDKRGLIAHGNAAFTLVRIAFASDRDGNWEIYVMNADGTAQTRLTNDAADDQNPAWSPDGSKIAFQSDRYGSGYRIYVMNADGTAQTRLTGVGYDENPAWSPDGSKIAFHTRGGGSAEIHVMNADGTGQTRLTNNWPIQDFAPSWSPGGSKIAFVSDRDGDDEIYVMNADGTGQTNLTNDPAIDHSPAWSP